MCWLVHLSQTSKSRGAPIVSDMVLAWCRTEGRVVLRLGERVEWYSLRLPVFLCHVTSLAMLVFDNKQCRVMVQLSFYFWVSWEWL